METKTEKTIYDLGLHETLLVEEKVTRMIKNPLTRVLEAVESIKTYEVTRVPNGWVYSFEFPVIGQSPVVFVPLYSKDEFKILN